MSMCVSNVDCTQQKSLLVYWISLILFCTPFQLRAQKEIIDFPAIENWKTIDNGICAISNNGAFFMWKTRVGNQHTMYIQSTAQKWKRSFSGASWLGFSRNNKTAVFSLPKDSLILFDLDSLGQNCLGRVRKSVFVNAPDSDYVIYSLKDEMGSLYIKNLLSHAEYCLRNIRDWTLIGDNSLLVTSEVDNKEVLKLFDILKGEMKTIWSGVHINQYFSNSTGDQIAFTVKDTIWYFKSGTQQAMPLFFRSSTQTAKESSFNLLSFSADSKWLFFNTLEDTSTTQRLNRGVNVDVWNYKDKQLQARQLITKQTNYVNHLCAVSLNQTQQHAMAAFSVLGAASEDVFQESPKYILGDFALFVHRDGGQNEDWWNPVSMPEVLLISLKDGTRRIIQNAQPAFGHQISFFISPGGKYLVYFNNLGGRHPSLQWSCMEISTGKTLCLTSRLKVPFDIQSDEDDMPTNHYNPYGLLGWEGEDKYVLIRDQYDIWRFDLTFSSAPVNLTKTFGRANKIQFSIVEKIGEYRPFRLWKLSDTILLRGYNTKTKETGLFSLQLDKTNFRQLTYGPYQFNTIVKAKDAGTWIVNRESESDAPNWFITHDLKKFDKITDIQPQKAYNWLTAELIHWRTFKGKKAEGLLYKPENFDSTKKYPVIVHYYEQMSEQFHQFLPPNYTRDDLNIPYMVSRGYLVFVPDIHYTIGETGESAYDFIVSGAEYLCKKPFVNQNRIGLQGHSFGGYETDYVITRSHLFAAAVSGSGWSDFVSRNGAILGRGESGQSAAEIERSRIGATLWERPDLYIENSPIFHANRITTPLLMMNNPMDDQVPFYLGTEFFTSLRRLQKPAWMLSYDAERHSLTKKENCMDFTTRMTQFFDHYLKDSLPPVWMTRGIPAVNKGIDTGYELDSEGICWDKCPVCTKRKTLNKGKTSKEFHVINYAHKIID